MRLLGLSGKKQSGKNSTSNFLHGVEMCSIGLVPNAIIDLGGKLVLPVERDGEVNQEIYDLDQNYRLMPQFCSETYWPLIKQYSFADLLKSGVCMTVMGLSYEQCYGTDEDKETKTEYRWEDMPGITTFQPQGYIIDDHEGHLEGDIISLASLGLSYHEPGIMTAREVLQYVGTEVFRKMNGDVWVNALLRHIENEQTEFAIITDCRFPNEVEAIQKAGGKVMRFTRCVDSGDSHASEKMLDDFDDFDVIIDNKDMDLSEQMYEVVKVLNEWEWLDEKSKEALSKVQIAKEEEKVTV